MTGRLLPGAVAVAAIAVLGWLGLPYRDSNSPEPRSAAERPALALLTSLPLVFGESFSLESSGSPTLTRLEQRYRVVPIGVADAVSLNGQRLLLMAHPRAQPADALTDLDRWVREGGRALLLADPRLDWPSQLPLGDPLRPSPMFSDTGLLAHWGLKLEAPDPHSEVTIGKLTSDNLCQIPEHDLIARCHIGKGQVTVIADADFLNVDVPEAPGLDRLIAELDRLESR